MATMSVLDRAYAESLLAGIQSGFDHAESRTNPDGTVTMTMYFTNGTSVDLTFDKPSANGFKGVEVRVVDGENHLICIMDDDSEIDAGILHTPTRVIHEQVFINPTNRWVIQHNLKEKWHKLDVKCLDGNNNFIYGEIDMASTTENLIVINFNEPTNGRAVIKK